MTLPRLSLAIFAICTIRVVFSRQIESSSCNIDPQEWCSNFSVAIECNAIERCIKTDWSEPSVLDGTCSTCVKQIENIREGLDSDTTKDVIQDALDYVCETTIFTRILRKQCEEVINKYIDKNINELLDLLKSDVDPQTICRVLHLCHTQLRIDKVSENDAVITYDNVILHIPITSGSGFQIPDLVGRISVPERKLVGAKKCTWGPSYWCGNLTTSKECGSTTKCIKSYWSQKQYDEDNDSVCQVCKDMVKQARDQLLSNETQDELRQVFEGSCKLIPIKEVRAECIKLADEFVPELTEVLASQMNPTAVCTVAGLCNSRRIDDLLIAETKKSDLSKMDSCVNCTAAFTAFENFMQNAAKEDVLGRMLSVCGELSSYSDLCSSLIASNFDDMFDIMKNQLSPPVACYFTGMCANRYHTHLIFDDVDFQNQVDSMLATHDDPDLPCDLCKQLVHHLQEILVANTTEDEFRQILHGMCEQTGNFRNECMKIVDEDAPIVYEFITKELDPTKICVDVNLCPKPKNLVSDANLNLISGRIVPVLKDEGNLAALSPLQYVDSNSDDSVECKFCHTVIETLKTELEDPKNGNDVAKVIEKICTLLPSSDRNRCDEFVDEYADVLVEFLANETNSFVICRKLRVCPSTSSLQVSSARESNNNLICSLCQDLLHYIQQALDDPKDENEIEDEVKKFCSIVPHELKDKCDDFISQYSALVISILSQEVDPSLVCPALKVCPSTAPPTERCTHCRWFMVDMIKRLENNYELDNIKSKVGSLAPIKGLEKSVTAVELRVSHNEALIDMLAAEFDADESCVYMKFCDVESASLPLSSVGVDETDVNVNRINDNQPSSSKPSCEICELFVKMYEKELMSNKTEEELENMLEHFCSKMKNSTMKDSCDKLVEKYVPIFFDLLKKNVSPKELCAAAKLCSLRSLTSNIDTECSACEMAVGSLESILGDPIIKENMFERAVKVCDLMANKSHSVCVQVVTELLPQIEGLVFDIPAWYVCAKMKMCPYGDHLDTTVCSNPNLWCQDMKTAFLCDRLNLCRHNVVWPSVAAP